MSPPRAWHPAVVARLARTLDRNQPASVNSHRARPGLLPLAQGIHPELLPLPASNSSRSRPVPISIEGALELVESDKNHEYQTQKLTLFLVPPWARTRQNRKNKMGSACGSARPVAQGHNRELRSNPSFKPSPNSVARRPASAGPAAHFALAVRRATLSGPA